MQQLEILEYEALRAEERDRMNGRLQIWVIYLSLVSAFGVVSVQAGLVAYVVGLFPFLASCLARHVRHSEDALKQVRKYLHELEKRLEYQGYECFSRSLVRPSHGGYLDALRDALLITQLLALVVVAIHLTSDHIALFLIVPIVALAASPMYFTWRWLRK